jgi:hypothetical protein
MKNHSYFSQYNSETVPLSIVIEDPIKRMKNKITQRYKKNESDDESETEKITSRSNGNESDGDDGSESGSDWSSEDEENDQKGSDDDDDEDSEMERKEEIEVDENIPLYQLLQQHSEKLEKPTIQSKQQLRRLPKKDHDNTLDLASPEDDEGLDDQNSSGKKSKNAPTEMRSDRPVKRLRMTEMQTNKRKFIDPRFVDYTGDLSQKHYAKNFEFIEEMKENELYLLRKKHKKMKNETDRSEIKHEINT